MPDELGRAFRDWRRGRVEASSRYVRRESRELQQHMRTPGVPPWQDRTTDARTGLYVRTTPVTGSHGYWIYDIEMGYSVQYGYWLELKKYGEGDQFESQGSKWRRADRTIRGYMSSDPSAGDWGRDSILLKTMPVFFATLQAELERIWSQGNVFDYEPRFSRAAGIAYEGQAAPGGNEGRWEHTPGGFFRRFYSGPSYMPLAGWDYESPRGKVDPGDW